MRHIFQLRKAWRSLHYSELYIVENVKLVNVNVKGFPRLVGRKQQNGAPRFSERMLVMRVSGRGKGET